MLTHRQAALLDFIKTEIARCGVAPTYEEMGAHLGLKSKSGVMRLLLCLEERGTIRRIPNRTRAIEINNSRRITTLTLPDSIDLAIGLAHMHQKDAPGSLAKQQLLYHLREAKAWLDKLPKGEA